MCSLKHCENYKANYAYLLKENDPIGNMDVTFKQIYNKTQVHLGSGSDQDNPKFKFDKSLREDFIRSKQEEENYDQIGVSQFF